MEKLDLALEELRRLDSIIARHDEMTMKIKNWCIGLDTVIITAIIRINFKISELIMISTFLVALIFCFLWIEAIFRLAMDRSIIRSGEIEREIQTSSFGEYPKINETLQAKSKINEFIKSGTKSRSFVPYIIILVIDALVITSKFLL